MENGLTLSLEETQSVLALEDLSGTLEALSKLLRAAEYRGRERGSSGATWRVVWLHHSVPTVVVAPDPPHGYCGGRGTVCDGYGAAIGNWAETRTVLNKA